MSTTAPPSNLDHEEDNSTITTYFDDGDGGMEWEDEKDLFKNERAHDDNDEDTIPYPYPGPNKPVVEEQEEQQVDEETTNHDDGDDDNGVNDDTAPVHDNNNDDTNDIEPALESNPHTPPSVVFIVPYRDREEQKQVFHSHMTKLLNGVSWSYQILYVHQRDTRKFNRGALKNLGFLWIKATWPETYGDVTLVLNDVDTLPTNLLPYHTTPGVVKHFYGFQYALGGIVSIRAADFEAVDGFPNFWAWGFEDNALQHRVHAHGFSIDRTTFYPFGEDKQIIHHSDGPFREVNRGEYDRFVGNTTEGWQDLQQIKWELDADQTMLHVDAFDTPYTPTEPFITYDLRNGSAPFKPPQSSRRSGRAVMSMAF